MRDEGTTAVPSTLRGHRLETVQTVVRELGEERDLRTLAVIAEISLSGLRQLVERPSTCSTLDEMLLNLDHLNLNGWETDED